MDLVEPSTAAVLNRGEGRSPQGEREPLRVLQHDKFDP